jgi:hypothetical protein
MRANYKDLGAIYNREAEEEESSWRNKQRGTARGEDEAEDRGCLRQ